MSTTDWLRYGNIACLIPIAILLIQYVIRTDWKVSETGRAFALLITLSFANFVINFTGSITQDEAWSWVRVFVKFCIAIGLLNLVRVMENARKEAIEKAKEIEENL